MNLTAYFRVYEELNDHLPENKKKVTFSLSFSSPITVLEAVRYLDLPPEKVDLVLINGGSADFGGIISNGDRVSIYPIFESLDISGVTKLRDKPLIKLKEAQKKTGSTI